MHFKLTYSIPPREGYNQSIIARSTMKYPTETYQREICSQELSPSIQDWQRALAETHKKYLCLEKADKN